MPTSDMTLKQQHKTAEMATNDTKIGCNTVTTSEKSANTIYSKMAFPQYAKRQVLKIRK